MKQQGYVTILAVLILGAVSLAIATSLLEIGGFSQKNALAIQQSTQARIVATSCVEEALQLLHDNTAYTGTNTLTLSGSTCSYTVASTGSNAATITASSTVGNTTRREKAYVTISSTSVSITQWQEIL